MGSEKKMKNYLATTLVITALAMGCSHRGTVHRADLIGTWRRGPVETRLGFQVSGSKVFRDDGTFTLTIEVPGETQQVEFAGLWSFQTNTLTTSHKIDKLHHTGSVHIISVTDRQMHLLNSDSNSVDVWDKVR